MSKINIFFDIPFVLTSLTLITGVVALLDIFVFSKKKRHVNHVVALIFEYGRSFFPVFLLVLLIRSFLIQPFRVPTGSLAPTILPGDLIVVNQYIYGLRLPVLNIKVLNIGGPKRGDIALFRFPNDPSKPFVKRVVGLPGDHVTYRNKMLTVNGKVAKQTPSGMDLDITAGSYPVPVQVRDEYLDNVTHKIFIVPGYKETENIDVYVPPNSYLMMGDNRDNSNDGREWGFVPEENLMGKAIGIWMSWDSENYRIRWQRIGTKIH